MGMEKYVKKTYKRRKKTFDAFVMILCALGWSMSVEDIQAEKCVQLFFYEPSYVIYGIER